MPDISNSDDVIDSRDVIARIDELTEERQELVDIAEDDEDGEMARQAVRDWDHIYGDELAALQALATEAEGYAADWKYGETLIRYSYFKEYAMQLADDLGLVDSNAGWPMTCIDWDQAARELRMDYTAVEFGGVTYCVR